MTRSADQADGDDGVRIRVTLELSRSDDPLLFDALVSLKKGRRRVARLRTLAPRTPGWLARCVRRCLRGKATRRLESATDLRRELEERLGGASPADARTELASWLWRHQIHEAQDGETVVCLAARAQSPSRRIGAWLVTALVYSGLLLASSMLLRQPGMPLEPGNRTLHLKMAQAADVPSP